MTPFIRKNNECGLDNNISAGREPCQLGWYSWACKNYCQNKTVLDVGAGMCDGIKLMRTLGSKSVYGQDIDNRLCKLDDNLLIKSIFEIDEGSYDVVTCFDVIEHVIEDLDFFNYLKRIAKEILIITTPNFTRSKALNHYHCREYTLPQFTNIFLPDELWTASPDGSIHNTLLLKKTTEGYIDMTRSNTIYIPLLNENLNFTHSTVDGHEWPHICGLFYNKVNYH